MAGRSSFGYGPGGGKLTGALTWTSFRSDLPRPGLRTAEGPTLIAFAARRHERGCGKLILYRWTWREPFCPQEVDLA